MTSKLETTAQIDREIAYWGYLLNTLLAVVTEAGNQGVPSGHVYAQLMGAVSLDNYERAVRILTAAGRVELKGNVLKLAPKPN